VLFCPRGDEASLKGSRINICYATHVIYHPVSLKARCISAFDIIPQTSQNFH
jgi:hypothetical protein